MSSTKEFDGNELLIRELIARRDGYSIFEERKPYQPDELPLKELDYKRLLPLVATATASVARYDALVATLAKPEVILAPLARQEAVISSEIEGIYATAKEVMEYQAGISKEGGKKLDIEEILNCQSAMGTAQQHVQSNRISVAAVCSWHKTLLEGERGKRKQPGQLRSVQNWIGRPGSTLQTAVYIPPAPEQIANCMAAWERYVSSDDIDPLIQTAVMHAQFELIHPFCDGNGRSGRLLVPLLLYQQQVTSQPVFYLSASINKFRGSYYRGLRCISKDGDWDGWIEYFLKVMADQATSNIQTVKKILALYEKTRQEIHGITKSQHTDKVLDAIFTCPLFNTSTLIESTGMHKSSAMTLLQKLKEQCILQEIRPSSGRRPAVLGFPPLLDIAN